MISYREPRDHINARICDVLVTYSLITQRKRFDLKNNTLYSTTISGTFCTLLVAPVVFENERAALTASDDGQNHSFLKAVGALGLLSDVTTSTNWYLKLYVDRYKSVQNFSNSAGMELI